MVLDIIIPGKPTAKARPRFSRRSGTAHTAGSTRRYEKWVSMCGRMAMAAAGLELTSAPVALAVHVYFARPSQIKKTHPVHGALGAVPLAAGGGYPDLSNVIKAIEDGLEGVVYKNDHQIWQICAAKWWSAPGGEAQVVVRISIDDGAVHV